jgi:hypothetical protein
LDFNKHKFLLGEFGKIGDSEKKVANPIKKGQEIVFLFRHLTFLRLLPFHDPDIINLHVLMVLSIGGIANAMLLPELHSLPFCLKVLDFKWKSIFFPLWRLS